MTQHERGGRAAAGDLSVEKSVAACCRFPLVASRGHKKAESGKCSCTGPLSTGISIVGGIRISWATLG